MPVTVPAGSSLIVLTFTRAGATGSLPTTTFGANLAPSLTGADAVYDWWHDLYRPLQDSNAQLLKIRMTNVVGEFEVAVNEAGARSGTNAPPNTSALVQKRTGVVGRANRGRMFWPWVLGFNDVGEDGQILGSTLEDLAACATGLFDAMAPFGDGLQLFHNGSSDPTTITELRVQGQVATQRRRNRK